MAYLGVNVDHVATVREARYRGQTKGLTPEPDPVAIAAICERAGAAGITVHLREDRRHIQDRDVQQLRRTIRSRLNLEMAVTPAMLKKALQYRPDEVCLVPENRQEITTEGGLNVAGQKGKIREFVQKLSKRKIVVSLFIDPDLAQVEAAIWSGAPCIELHTGGFANATSRQAIARELKRQQKAAQLALSHGLQVNAGHGLHYNNVKTYLAAVPQAHTLNIGHSIVSRALVVGFDKAVREMIQLIRIKK